jgi:hypothetical protein
VEEEAPGVVLAGVVQEVAAAAEDGN